MVFSFILSMSLLYVDSASVFSASFASLFASLSAFAAALVQASWYLPNLSWISILILSNFIPTIYFGIFTGIAMMLAMISVLTLLPKLILTFKPFGEEVDKF